MTEGITMCRRGVMAMVKRFVGLFIGYKGGGGSKRSMICSFQESQT